MNHTTESRITVALAWLGFCFLAWFNKDNFKPASDQNLLVMFAIMLCQIVPIFVATGALFGRARLLGAIGLVLMLCFFAYFLIAVTFFSPI